MAGVKGCVIPLDLYKAFDLVGAAILAIAMAELCFPLFLFCGCIDIVKNKIYKFRVKNRIADGSLQVDRGTTQGGCASTGIFLCLFNHLLNLLCRATNRYNVEFFAGADDLGAFIW